MKKAYLQREALMLLALISSLVLSCAGPHVATIEPTPPLYPTHRPYRLYEVWFDTTYLYDRSLFTQAKQAISNWIDKADCGIANSDGFDIDINFITSNSFNISPNSFTIHCEKIGMPPQPPMLTPTPTQGSNPYDTSAQSAVVAANQKAINDYNGQITSFRQTILGIENQVHQGTDKLRLITPAVDKSGSDIYGMIKRASYRFENVQGERHLFIISSLTNTTNINYTDTSPLYNASVILLWWTCQQVSHCSANIDNWYDYFKVNGAADYPTRYDPNRSINISNPFE